MIQAYFGLKKLPFVKELKTIQMYETFDLRETGARLQLIKQNRGIFCLTGEPGSGKTSALRKFVEELNPQTHQHCYTPHATINRSDLYRQLNTLLKLPQRVRKSDLFDQIQRGVMDLYEGQGKTPVIILDEAHLMDHETLQELIELLVPWPCLYFSNCILHDRTRKRSEPFRTFRYAFVSI